ncbi:uncharacterized protein LOC111378017 [Olea europaea var. sylvestris]|uniref:uncharacterized protein LOC111378017 n=1 Tax=Olea europaea var. sylvestris TaxID=158386 RepID=UPI000C1CD0C7|nr:uncharacterized protein LOC111378017 [Olea europaea var. sylvestris]
MARHELLSFMDAYSSYNQIPMHPADEEHPSFITDRGKTMEVYVEDMLVKSLEAGDHTTHFNSTFQILRRYRIRFQILRRYRMRLNPLKCTFRVASDKFLGYMVNQRGIEANPEKIEALCKMRGLSGLEKAPRVGPLLSKPKPSKILQLYLAVSNEAISAALQKPDTSGRLLKWAVELSEFDLVFKARATIKGQALADFMAKFANLPEVDEIMEQAELPTWNLFVDGSTGDVDSSARVVLISPKGHKLNSTMRFGFKATNNVTEYEALLAGLRLAKEMQVKRLLISNDSQPIVSQISRVGNAHADALSNLASSKDSELLTVVPIEHLLMPSTEVPNVMWVTGTPTWMQPIVAYLKDQVLPTDKHKAYKLRKRSAHFLFIDDVLYKRSSSSPLLRCVGGEEATYILREVHKGVCGNHSGGLSLAQKILRQGYYWPTLKRDALEFVLK